MVIAEDQDVTQDPLRALIALRAPLFIPYCTDTIIDLGHGFDSRRALSNASPWTANSALVRNEPLDVVCELDSGAVCYRDITTTSSNSKADHTSASLCVTAGTKSLNVNAQGKYEENNSKSSQITFNSMPSIDVAALNEYRASPDSFHTRYGDYYVAGLQLGGEAGLSVTFRADSEEHDKSVKVTITLHAFLWDESTDISEVHREARSSIHFDFSGYNSLTQDFTNKSCDTSTEASNLRNTARAYLNDVTKLRATIQQKIAAMNLEKSCPRTVAQCRTLCTSGLVLNYILRPYEQSPEFVALQLQARDRVGQEL